MLKRRLSIIFIFICANSLYAQDTAFKPHGNIGGYFFGDYAYKVHADSIKRENLEYSNIPKDQPAFNLRRVYLTYDYNFSPKFTAEVILTYEGLAAAGTNRNIFLKIADIRWKDVLKRTDLVFGQMATPTFNLMGKIWGYRSAEKTIADMRGLSPSSDLGIGIQGRFNDKGTAGYNFMYANGTGVRPENDKYKRIYLNAYAKFLKEKLIVDFNTDYEKVAPVNGLQRHKQLYKIGLAYQTKKITIGTEVLDYRLKNFSNVYTVSGIDTIKSYRPEDLIGFSIFARGSLTKKITAFIRYDSYNPDADYSSNFKYYTPYNSNNQSFFLVGVDYQPIEKIHIMPNFWYNHYHSKKEPAASSFEKNDYDAAARLTVFVNFR